MVEKAWATFVGLGVVQHAIHGGGQFLIDAVRLGLGQGLIGHRAVQFGLRIALSLGQFAILDGLIDGGGDRRHKSRIELP